MSHIFISHTTADDAFVKILGEKLSLHQLTPWIDSRNQRAGTSLSGEIEQAIKDAKSMLVVLSPNAINSSWIPKEIAIGLQMAQEKTGYTVIPLLLPGVAPEALNLWFKDQPYGIQIALELAELDAKLPAILAALGQRLPDDDQAVFQPEAQPVAELLLALSHPKIYQLDTGKYEISAEAKLTYTPPDSKLQPEVTSKPFLFLAPLDLVDMDELRWYLEKYAIWPVGIFQERARRLEQQLPQWGQKLYQATLAKADLVIAAWQSAGLSSERRFSVYIDASVLEDSDMSNARIAASRLQALPWELLHDGTGFLSQGANAVRVRRRLPNYLPQPPSPAQLPIRILVVSPRPEQDGVGYIDHRISAKPLQAAVSELGDLVSLKLLATPTLPALAQELKTAQQNHQPYHVVHFDGHGVYDPEHGLGALCFEHPEDSQQTENRRMKLVYADELAALLRGFRIGLVFLEACQSATTEQDPSASVAAQLLQQGISSVVAMSHSVLVETAQRFVGEFYRELARGQRVGAAMLTASQALQNNSARISIPGAGQLQLQDWFVPVLYQEQHDPQLFTKLPNERMKLMQMQQHAFALGDLPEEPTHSFIGRSRELLTLERLLVDQSYALIIGMGGEGKTTLAVELCRWLLLTNRFDRCVFVSLEHYATPRGIVDVIGQQLINRSYSVSDYGDDLPKALQPIQRELENQRCLLLFDNLESLFTVGWGEPLNPNNSPNDSDTASFGVRGLTPSYDVLNLLKHLQACNPKTTRLLLTSRERLPEPFNHAARRVTLSALSPDDAKALVMRVMNDEGLSVSVDKAGNTPAEVDALVTAVHCHARALVLIARELAIQGITATTRAIQAILTDLERRFPGNRELSLYASVQLSLKRLTPEMQPWLPGLAVMHDGVDIIGLSMILDITAEQALSFVKELVAVGLAEPLVYGYYRLDPALPDFLSLQAEPEHLQASRQRWLEAMAALVDFLLQQKFEDTQLQVQLTLLELPNLLAFIEQYAREQQQGNIPTTQLANLAGSIEQLLANLGRPLALAQVVAIRHEAANQLQGWSRANFNHERLSIERLLQQAKVSEAFTQAQSLLQQCQQAGNEAYTGADYDLAIALFMLGRVLITGGAANEALAYLQTAQQGFEAFGEDGARMASVCLTEQGDCLTALGQYQAAVAVCQQAIARAEQRKDVRQVAIGEFQLATVWLLQHRYPKALDAYREALKQFQQLGEAQSVASAWHGIGMVYREIQDFAAAETAYRQSLAIEVQHGNRAGEASSLLELGNLYGVWQQPEQAVSCYQHAAALYEALQDLRFEGFVRSNIANQLILLQKHDAARTELHRALECNKPYGHAAEPWKTWDILYDLEKITGNAKAATAARNNAMQAFLAYRRDGGENHSDLGQLAEASRLAIQQGDTTEMLATLENYLQIPNWQKHLNYLHALQALLQGNNPPAPESLDAMHYTAAAELLYLMETLPR